MSKSGKRVIGAIVVVIILVALALPKIRPLFNRDVEAGAATQAGPLEVEAYVVTPQSVQDKIRTTGTIMANEEVELRSEVSGKVTRIFLEEGRTVKKGQLLIKINDSELQAQLKRAEYRYELASDREHRQRQLLEKGGISQEDYDATLNEVNVLKSEMQLIKAQIDKTEIRAPFNGIVGLKYISEGSYISPSTRIATLQNINPVKIDFSVPERYANAVSDDDVIRFGVQGADRLFEGRIYAIEPKIDTQTRTVQLRALSGNRDGLLIPGAFADLELVLKDIPDALMVPSIAVIPELQGQKVYVFRSGKVDVKRVTTGIRTDDAIQILDGLSPQDTVLTTGLLQVRPGMPIQLSSIEQ